VFLGTIGRLVKIDSDEYIKTVAKILKQNPNTLYFACGAGNIDSIKEKLKKYDIPESRFVFTGQVNPHVFGWVIDIWLDSFPLRQGHSLVEAQAKGGAIVHYAPVLTQKDIDNMKNAYKEGEQDLNLKLPFYPIAENKDEYIKFADYLIKNDLDRRNVGDCFKKSLLKQLENPDISKFLEIINEN
jgi:glycosyltransferase involved in cell wall biosynthesis